MDLQPGPFLPGNVADVAVTPGVYDFTDDALTLSGELLAIYHDWDQFLDDLPSLAAGPTDPTLGIDDLSLIDEIDSQATIAEFPDIDSLGGAFNVALNLFSAAYSFAPAAAFSVPTAAFTPPDPTATIVSPQIPISEYTPDVTGLGAPTVTTSGSSVTLQNQTRVGQQNFVVGDTFLVTATGPPGSSVSVDGILNGVDLGTTTFGTTDANGNFSLSGVEGPDDVGQWIENWFVGGAPVATFNFIVTPAGD